MWANFNDLNLSKFSKTYINISNMYSTPYMINFFEQIKFYIFIFKIYFRN